jgi:hypothetical protein
MISKGLTHVVRICWATLLISMFIMSKWDKERAILGFLIVVTSWTSVKIVNEALLSTIELIKPKPPIKPDVSSPGGWSKDIW